jgi:hypothetical protein
MSRKKGLEEAEIQKLHTTVPEHLTDDELLLSTFCAEDLAARKHSGGWDNDLSKVVKRRFAAWRARQMMH